MRSSQDAVIAKTPEGIVTAWNDSATEIYGYSREAMIGRNIDITFAPETEDEERARHARVAQGEAESGYRCVRVRPDGRRVDVVMSMSPVRDEGERVVGVASISRPVSDEERANARVGSLLDAAPGAMVCVDGEGRISMVNTRLCEVFGYDRSELIGLPIERLVPQELHARHISHRDGYIGSPHTRPMGSGLPLRGRRKDGSTFPVEVSLAAEGPSSDRLVIAAVRDVTGERDAQASLLESETRLRQLAENVSTVFTLRQLDPPKYLYISPGMTDLCGYTPDEIKDDPTILFDQLIHPEDKERVYDLLTHQVATKGRAASEHRVVHRDGTVRWVRSVTSLVPNPDGRPVRVVGMTDDITDRVLATHRLAEAEAEARAANEAKNTFLSRTSHELRTPLNAVLGFSQLLALALKGTEHASSVDHVLKASRHLLALIDDVLDIALIEAGEMAVSIEPVSVSSVVSEVVALLTPMAEEARVRISVAPMADSLARADVQRLRQVLLNLLTNAVKYHRPGGRVWVTWTASDDEVVIAVKDDGRGIPRELQSRLFTPFDRLGAESSTVQGSGVGLAVTRSLVELMGGQVEYDSDTGRGSVFTVTLPAPPDHAGTPAPTATAPYADTSPAGQTSSTLLYVEDNSTNVEVMESVLGLRPGWRMIHAGLGQLGIDLARSHQPDLVLLDLHLPDLTGVEVLRALQEDPVTHGIPVVVVSADASHLTRRRVIEVGARRYLTKPYALEELLALLDDMAASPADGDRRSG